MAEKAPELEANRLQDDSKPKEVRRKRRNVVLWELLYEFSRNTTLHGLRYITEQGLSIIEKAFWLVTFLASLSCCAYFIYYVYEKWQTTPVIVTISEDMVHVNSIPFPSVTICPQTKCRSSVYSYSKNFRNIKKLYKKYRYNSTLDDIDEMFYLIEEPWFIRYADISTVCQNYVTYKELAYLDNKYVRNASLVHHIEEVAENYDMFERCKWRGEKLRSRTQCKRYFKKILTSEGVCYSFNTLAASEILKLENVHKEYDYLGNDKDSQSAGWHPYYGYTQEESINHYPRRGRVNAAFADLNVVLVRNVKEKDKYCNTLLKGYKVFIHHPADLPRSHFNYIKMSDNEATFSSLKCNIVNTSSKLLRKPVSERKCYKTDERQLAYFKMYSAQNCRFECLTNYTMEHCGCVGFYMPYIDSEHICPSTRTACIIEALESLANIESIQNITLKKSLEHCNCLPACYTVEYNAEIKQTDYDWKSLKELDNNRLDVQNNTDLRYSTLRVFFAQPEFVSMRRDELFGNTDFIANCGGLLGLFLGFSVLSIVEIFYFITLRLWYALKRDSKRNRGDKETKCNSKSA